MKNNFYEKILALFKNTLQSKLILVVNLSNLPLLFSGVHYPIIDFTISRSDKGFEFGPELIEPGPKGAVQEGGATVDLESAEYTRINFV